LEIKLTKTRNQEIYQLRINGKVVGHIRPHQISLSGFNMKQAGLCLTVDSKEYLIMHTKTSMEGDYQTAKGELSLAYESKK
jgi:hypothetical protein